MFQVEPPCLFVDRVDFDGTRSDAVRNVLSQTNRVEKEDGSKPLSLHAPADRQLTEKHDRNVLMSRKTFRFALR